MAINPSAALTTTQLDAAMAQWAQQYPGAALKDDNTLMNAIRQDPILAEDFAAGRDYQNDPRGVLSYAQFHVRGPQDKTVALVPNPHAPGGVDIHLTNTYGHPGAMALVGIGGAAGVGALGALGALPGAAAGAGGSTAAAADPASYLAEFGTSGGGAGASSAAGAGALPGAAHGFLSDLTQAAPLISTGVGALGSYLNARQQNQTLEQKRQDELRAQIAAYLQSLQSSTQTQAQSGVNATQLDPYAHAKQLNSANVRRSAGLAFGPTGFNGPIDLSALSPESLQSSADNFYTNVASASPNIPTPSSAAEVQRQKVLADQLKRQQQILQYLSMGLQ